MTTFGKPIRAAGCEEGSPQAPPRSPEHRERCIREDLTNRLKKICQDMLAAEFEDLILAMTREQLRSERLR